MQLQKPKNQYAQVVYLLIENGNRGVTMVDAMKDFFHKFGTRLLEVEKQHPKLKIRRLPMTKKNRFGHTTTFLNYKSLSPYPYMVNLVNKLNKEGMPQPKKKSA